MVRVVFRTALVGLLCVTRASAEGEGDVDVAPEATEPDAPRFGNAGQFALIASSQISLSTRAFSDTAAKSSQVTFEPALEYFVYENLSLGLEIDLAHSSSSGYGLDGSLFDRDYTLVGGGFHVGYAVRLARLVSLYPLIDFGIHHVHESVSPDEGTNATGRLVSVDLTGPWMDVLVPVLFHLAPHFFVGIGPGVYHDFSHADGAAASLRSERTAISGSLLFGGYFGGHSPPEEDSPRRGLTLRAPSHFGDVGTFVLSEESGLTFRSTSCGAPP